MKSEDHWHRSHEVKKYSRERHHLVKRHIRPVVGGAPFLVCYRCSEVLQLPADFLLFRRRCHQLRCSSCSVILKFSLQNQTHILPYTDLVPDAIAPPPSEAEVDGCSDVNNRMKLASSVSYAGIFPHPDIVSFSDGYGPSLGISCSTEGEPLSSALPFHAVKRDSNIRKLSSGSSCDPMGEAKMRPTFKVPRNKYKNPVESFASAGPSSQMSRAGTLSSEIEELPPAAPAGSSPLHRLMGYSSPSKVIRS